VGDGDIVLSVRSTPKMYAFSFEQSGKSTIELGSGEACYLTTEVAGGFTGVFIGLFASGPGRGSESPADFDWFDYRQTQPDPDGIYRTDTPPDNKLSV
jgi:xylan 1,4-beta-xylosidase